MNRNNVITAIILLAVLGVITSPSIAPNIVSRLLPGFYEGLPCEWLRTGEDRDRHQSILGRAATAEALSVEVDVSAIPADASGVMIVRVVLVNNTIGTLAIVYNPNQILVGDNGSSGIGLNFTPAVNVPLGAGRTAATTIPETDIRLLGPRQRCVHTLEIPAGNLAINPTFLAGQGLVAAYYRNNTPGQVIPQPGPTPIYTDQGLWTGFAVSNSVQVSPPPVQ